MDNFTFGMFGELSSYEDCMEFEAWLEATEGVGEIEPSDEDWEEIDRQEAQKEEDDWWNY